MRGLERVPARLEDRARQVLTSRLASISDRPIAVALSGGGDSVALLLLTCDWAASHGRKVVALTVDHALQPQASAWAADCADLCARLGVAHRTLVWTGGKPATGLPAAARAARHRLLADAARAEGATVILLGHTADDLIEAAEMRRAGSTVPDARLWSPSPVWPQGRGLFLLRPLLGERRADLRQWLTARGQGWINDPANDDDRFSRARARRTLATASAPPSPSDTTEAFPLQTQTALGTDWGGLRLSRAVTGPDLAAACLCASGSSRPPRGERVRRLLDLLAADADVTATLCGARLESRGDGVLVMREPGELSRRPQRPLDLPQNRTVIFDGRFELTAFVPGLRVQPLAGHTGQLPKSQQQALKSLPPAARKGLPLVSDDAGLWTCPILAASALVSIRSLALQRFEAFQGRIVREPDGHHVAGHGEAAGGDLSSGVTIPVWKS